MRVNINEKPVSKLGWIITGTLLLVLLIAVGCVSFAAGLHTNLNNEAVAAAAKTITETNDEYLAKKEELDETTKKLSENEATLSAMNEYQANKETLDQEIADKSSELETLNTDVTAKQNELDSLTQQVTKAKGAPKTLSSGQFVVGTDLPPGRYNVSGSSNFVVYGSNGRLKVNTILGNSLVGEGDYVCTLSTGDEMQLSARTTFTPIE